MSGGPTVQITDSMDTVNEVNDENVEDIVDPWTVQSSNAKGVDYDKLISEFSD